MTFSWPWALLALLVLPALLAAWWLTRRRRRRATVKVTSIALIKTAVPGGSSWRRRIPVALLAVGIAVLVIGAARPQATVPVTSAQDTIMLTLDVSGSMCETDVSPNRITAAENAAAAFIKSQSGGPRIGIVDFSGSAAVLVPPTTNTQQLLNAIPTLVVGGGTAIGDGILASLDAIAQVDSAVAPSGAKVTRAKGAGYADDVIVVLTDGSNNRGVLPETAAQEAAARGVRIDTIGYGTANPAPMVCAPGQTSGFGGGGGGGGFNPGGIFNPSTNAGGGVGGGGAGAGGNPLQADYTALQQVSRTSGGQFFTATNAKSLNTALSKLPAAFTIVHKQEDLANAFAGFGALLTAAAVALSLLWTRMRNVSKETSAPEGYRKIRM